MELRTDPGLNTDRAAEEIETQLYGDAGAPPEPVAKTPERPSTPTIEDRISRSMSDEPVETPRPEARPAAVPNYVPSDYVANNVEIPSDLMPEVTALQNEYQSIDWVGLKSSNPGLYAALQIEMQQRAAVTVQKIAQRNAEKQHLSAAQQAEAQRLQEATIAEARKELHRLIPEWRDPKVRERESQELFEALESWGYSETEISRAADPRIFAMLRHYMKEAKRPKAPSAPKVDPVEQELKRRNWSKTSTEAAVLKIEKMFG